MNGGLIFLLILLLLVIIPAAILILYTRLSAKRRGLPPPPLSAYNPVNLFRSNRTQPSAYPIAPRPSNPLTWIQDKISSLRNRSSGGLGGSSRSTRGHFGPLDPDGAWDDRVGNEAEHLGPGGAADYEEQELGLHPAAPGHYGGSGYGSYGDERRGLYDEPEGPQELPAYGEERGRTRSRDPVAGEGFIGGGQRGLDARYEEEMHGGEREDPFGDGAERSDLRGVSPRPVEEGRGSVEVSSRKSAFREGI